MSDATPSASTAPSGRAVFVMLVAGRARLGEEDAIIALHEDWVRRRSADGGLLSSEILVDPADPPTFLAISHFLDRDAAERSWTDPEHAAWRRRLASLSEAQLAQREMLSLWRASSLPSEAPTQRAPSQGKAYAT
jgi:quinol monooxygenase YgiN